MIRGSQLRSMLRESMRMTVEAIVQNKLRAILTLLGISIGVFSVIGVMTAIRTLETSIESGLNVFGTNTFLINKTPAIQFGPGSRSKYRNRKNIDYRQYELLKERAKLPILVSVVDSEQERSIRYKDKLVNKTVEISGGDENALRTLNTFVEDGRNLTQDDIQFSRNVCLLGGDVIDKLFPFEDPLGKVIQIKGLNYTVVGTIERKGELFGGSQDNFILIPITNYLQKFSDNRTSLGITVEAASVEDYDKTQDEVIGIMRTIRKVPPEKENDFEVTSNTELLETFGAFTGGVKIFAFSVSVIALLVAGIGIMNIMLVSVTERIKEIGIRKAIGATRGHILTQFLTEAVFLSQFGGIVGVILGIAAGNLVAVVLNVSAVIPFDWAFYGLLVCSLIGIGFGSYPAWRAANLYPIESLRFE
ncbi:MAG: ABC transporter permease [Candidatus Neomarinimicrobiota bacterium]|nr:ABC transporter permease [Candidatus Neomarinimicrobiota bacterium]